MSPPHPHHSEKILTLPEAGVAGTSIRAKALVFHDPGSHLLLARVERLARSEATVLVTGETGTGKELIARHIHAASGRAGPFVAVNCGAFSETLIDAELFGHEAGAFTGAAQARAGWFEVANGGTLFLDEIGDLPLALQVKLLRVLQERQVVRLGSRRGTPLDVRLVAATNIDLARAVEAHRFRADLYYRLRVADVRLPPLRERRGDILPLARHFVTVYRGRLELEEVTLGEDAQAVLLGYFWPGNIRELENVIHSALIVCKDNVVRADDLNLVPLSGGSFPWTAELGPGPGTRLSVPVQTVGPAPAAVSGEPPRAAPQGAMERLTLAWQELLGAGQRDLFERVESVLIHAAYEHCRQNQVRTARALGITRNMLRTQLKRHGLLRVADEVAESSLASEAEESVLGELRTEGALTGP